MKKLLLVNYILMTDHIAALLNNFNMKILLINSYPPVFNFNMKILLSNSYTPVLMHDN